MTESFKPIQSIEQTIHFWWVIVIFTLIGALAGWGMSRIRQPVYEAKTQISTSIDFTRTGTLTDIEEDLIFVTVGDIIFSSSVGDQGVDKARISGIGIDLPTFRQESYLERMNQTWVMRVRNTDPKIALQLSNLWLDAAMEKLQIGYKHAIAAEQYYRYLDSLSSCMGQLTVVEPVNGFCQISNLGDLQKEIQKAGILAQQEKEASMGISPALMFSPINRSEIVEAPVLYGANTQILFGAIIGFIIGIWVSKLSFLTSLYTRNLSA